MGIPVLVVGGVLFVGFFSSALAGVLDVAAVLLLLAVLCIMIGVNMR